MIALLLCVTFFIYLTATGSSIDPDDNGWLRSKESRAKYRQSKLDRFK